MNFKARLRVLSILVPMALLPSVSGADMGQFTTLYTFTNGSDGAAPFGQLVEGADGAFYGTTDYGGSFTVCIIGCGTVFKITPAGVLTTLHRFDNSDGSLLQAGLSPSGDGGFLGTAAHGARFDNGSVFKIAADGSFTKLAEFGSGPGNANAPPIMRADGKIYGTVASNFTGDIYTIGAGGLSMLYTFSGSDGTRPYSTLLQASDGNFYGTTIGGGPNTCATPVVPYISGSCGTVFKMTPSGTLTTLHTFSGPDGAYPFAGLIQGSDGNFYGTTYAGGSSTNCPGGCGTVYRMTPTGTVTVLHSFNGSDGTYPWAPVAEDNAHNLYGTTVYGGGTSCAYQQSSPVVTGGCGTVFRLDPSGRLMTIHAFTGTDGAYPYGGPIVGADGNLYGTSTGTTVEGIPNIHGAVYRLKPPLLGGPLGEILNANLAAPYVSQPLTINGLGKYHGISVINGQYQLNGGPFTSTPGTVSNGDVVRVQQTSSSSFNTRTNTWLLAGGQTYEFAVFTRPPDTTPDPFSFPPVVGADPGVVYTSSTVAIAGLEPGYDGTPVSISGGQYSINGGPYTAAPGTIGDGDTVSVEVTSSAGPGKSVQAWLAVGKVHAGFKVTTRN